MKSFQKSIILFTIFSLVLGSNLPKGISVHRLNNGMDVILIENRSLPMVGVNVVVKTGSAYETFSTSGMSHMLEHLLFNGTTTRTQKELYNVTDRIGGYNNANTGEYYTNYMMVTPAEHIQAGMEIQADMLFRSILPIEKFEKEKGIVLEEIAQNQAYPETQIEDDIQSILFQGHSLSLPTIGTYSTIESLSLEKVHQYYEGNYIPNNMILSVIGNFDSADMLEWVKDIYGKATPGKVFHPQDTNFTTGFDAPNFAKGSRYHRSHSDSTTLIHLAFPLPIKPVPGFFDLMNKPLSSEMEKVQSKAKKKFGRIVKSVSAEIYQSPVENFLIVKATLESGDDLDRVVSFLKNAVLGMKFSMKKDAVTAFKAAEQTFFFKNLEKPHMFGIYNAHVFAEKGIDGFLDFFNPDLYTNATDALKNFKVTGHPTIIIHHPIKESSNENFTHNSAQLFDHDRTGTTIIAKQNPGSPLLGIHYLFKHKTRLEKKYGKDAAKILHDCFGQRMKSEAIQKKSGRFGLSFKVNDNPFIPMDNYYLHDDFGYIRVEGLVDNMEDVIAFLNASFLEFTPTENEFVKAASSFKNGHRGMSQKNEAKEKFNKLVDEQIYKSDKNKIEPPKLTYESLLAFTKKYWTPENLIISVVSPKDPATLNDLFTGFGNTKKLDTEPVLEDSYKLNSKQVTIEEKDNGTQSYLFWGFIKKINPNDKPALTALSLILSDKIIFDIREKQGMAYRMHAGISIKKDKALFSINFGTRPENVDVLTPQFPGFFTLDILTDVDEAMLEKSINMYVGRMMFRRLSSVNQAYYLGHSLYFDGDMNADAQFLNGLKLVTLDDVDRVAKKYMDRGNPISIIVR